MTTPFINALRELQDVVRFILSQHHQQQQLVCKSNSSNDNQTAESLHDCTFAPSNIYLTQNNHSIHTDNERRVYTSSGDYRIRPRRRKMNNRQHCNTYYERKRALRRLQRALLSFEEVMINTKGDYDGSDDHEEGETMTTRRRRQDELDLEYVQDRQEEHIRKNQHQLQEIVDDDHDDNVLYDNKYDVERYHDGTSSYPTRTNPLLISTSSSSSSSSQVRSLSNPKMLDESSLNILFDILTEIPKGLPSSSSPPSSLLPSTTITSLPDGNTQLDHQYNQDIVPITCSIIERFAVLPLNPTLIDKLLDRIANILSRQNHDEYHHQQQQYHRQHVRVLELQQQHQKEQESICFLNMIQIINTSLLARDQQLQQYIQQQGRKRQDMEEQRKTDNCKGNSNNNNLASYKEGEGEGQYGNIMMSQYFDDHDVVDSTTMPLLLLNANETIALTQLLIPLSLKHLSNEWEFIIPTTATYYFSSSVGDTRSSASKTMINTSSSSMALHQSETIIIDDDDNVDDNHMNGSNELGTRMEYDNPNNNNTTNASLDDEERKQMKDLLQEGEVQLRVLLGYLFRHLATIIQRNNHSSNIHGHTTSCGTSTTTSLEETLFQLFNSTTSGCDLNHRLDHQKHKRMMLVEDYIDLISSYLIESIEYAIDVMDTASHSLQRIIQSENIRPKYNGITGDDFDLSVIRRYIKDTVRHCSIVVGLAEILYEDVGFQNYLSGHNSAPSSSSLKNDSHLGCLFKSFADFIAHFCNDELLHGEFCISNSEDIETGNVLFYSADNVLFRLNRIITATEERKEETMLSREYSDNVVEVTKIEGSLKRRKCARNSESGTSLIRFMDTASIVCLLRSFHRLNQSHGHDEEYEAARLVLHSAMMFLSNNLQRPCNINSGGVTSGHAYTNAYTNMVQACALSNLLLFDQAIDGNEDDEENARNLIYKDSLLVSLLFPIMNKSKNVDQSYTTFVDGNPWSFLLANKMLDVYPQLNTRHGASYGNASVSLPAAVSISSVSSVSDLKSNFASATSTSSGDGKNPSRSLLFTKELHSSELDQIISSFVQATPECFKTLG